MERERERGCLTINNNLQRLVNLLRYNDSRGKLHNEYSSTEDGSYMRNERVC